MVLDSLLGGSLFIFEVFFSLLIMVSFLIMKIVYNVENPVYRKVFKKLKLSVTLFSIYLAFNFSIETLQNILKMKKIVWFTCNTPLKTTLFMIK